MISILAAAAIFQPSFRSLNSHSLPPSTNDYWFVALGDNRPAGAGLPPDRTFKQLLEEVSLVGPKFVISSGDLLYGNEESIGQYQQEIQWAKTVLEALPCPFYNAPGNHEINNKAEFLAEYTKNWGATYGSFEYGGIRFVAVCTELPAEKPSVFGPQKDWLSSLLAASKPTVIFQHHPIFARPTNTDKDDKTVDDAEKLHALYTSSGTKLVVEGHDHIYDLQRHDGVQYTITGGGGSPLDGSAVEGGFFHFLLVHVADGKIETTPIPAGTLEVLQRGDGKAAACNYSDVDLKVTNLLIDSKNKPSSVTATYSKKNQKPKEIPAKIVETKPYGKGYRTRVEMVLPKHRASIVALN